MGLQRTQTDLGAGSIAASSAAAITPRLLLDETRMLRNIERMNNRLLGQGVTMRPHVKTAKSLPIIKRMLAGQPAAKVTVSTLAEARACVAAGITDFLYAVGMVPAKLAVVRELNQAGGECSVLLDSRAMAQQLGAAGCLLYTSPSPRDATLSRMPSSA